MKKHFAIDRMFVAYILAVAFSVFCSDVFFDENDIGGVIVMLVIAVALVAFSCITTPCWYIFDREGVSIYYLFAPKNRYLWKNIRSVEVETYHGYLHRLDIIFPFFQIDGVPEGKPRFYMEGFIRKTRRTKRYIERYWDGEVTGYFGEGIKKWWHRRNEKENREIKAHLTDEIVPMEREVRAKVREIIAPYTERAALYNLEMRTKYLYTTSKITSTSRPNEGYRYTVLAGICEVGENDEARIVEISVDLIHVRLGKKAYRGVENELLDTELNFYLNDTLEEIIKSGIDAYLLG